MIAPLAGPFLHERWFVEQTPGNGAVGAGAGEDDRDHAVTDAGRRGFQQKS